MTRSKKGGIPSRRAGALARLEKQYEKFVHPVDKDGNPVAVSDKQPRVTKKWVVNHVEEVIKPGRSFAAECKRMQAEIAALKLPKKKKKK